MIGKTSLSLFGAAMFANSVSHTAIAQKVEDQPDNKEKPNILMIVIDDMNNWVGSLGGKAITPNIDRLASQGVLFSNAYCVVPASNPSRTAMMTGLRPETTWQWTNDGLWREKLPQNEDIVTLGQLLQQNGYITEAAGKIFHHPRGRGPEPSPSSDPASWTHQYPVEIGTPGSDLYRDKETGKALWHEGTLSGYFGTGCFWGPVPYETEECGDYMTADSCAKFLSRDHDSPFFFALGIFRPHSPQLAPQKYFDMYPIDKIALPENVEEDLQDIDPGHRQNFFTPLVRQMIERKTYRGSNAWLSITAEGR